MAALNKWEGVEVGQNNDDDLTIAIAIAIFPKGKIQTLRFDFG